MENNKHIFVDLFAAPSMEESAKEVAKYMKAQYDAFIEVGFAANQAMVMVLEILRASISGGKQQ